MQLAHSYVEEQRALDSGSAVEGTSEEIMRNSVSFNMPLVASPVSKEFRPLTAYFISSLDDLHKQHSFTFHFNDSSRLCGLEVETAGANGSRLLGEKAPISGSSAKTEAPAGAWITGLELNIGKDCQDLGDDAVIGITGIKVNTLGSIPIWSLSKTVLFLALPSKRRREAG